MGIADKPNIPNFHIETLICSGNWGQLWKAQNKLLRRTVSVKLPINSDGQTLNSVELANFITEAKLLAAVEHKNIIRVYAVGSLESGQPYLEMEYLDGSTLKEILQKRKLNTKQLSNICQGMLSGLCAIHQKGIIHGDLRTANILVCRQSGEDVAKILDFRLSRREAVSQQEGDKTGTTLRLFNNNGDFKYASPEACLGKDLDRRSDIYSLGCIIYESIQGRTPFAGGCEAELKLLHVNSPPPNLKTGLSFNEKLNEKLLQALSKSPQERYQSAEDFELSLQDLLRRYSIERTSAPSRLILFSLLLSLGVVVILAITTQENHSIQNNSKQKKRTRLESPEGNQKEIVTLRKQYNGAVAPEIRSEVIALARRGRQIQIKQGACDPFVAGRLENDLYDASTTPEEVDTHARASRDFYRKAGELNHAGVVGVGAARNLLKSGPEYFTRAKSLAEGAKHDFEQSNPGGPHPQLGSCLCILGCLAHLTGQQQISDDCLKKCILIFHNFQREFVDIHEEIDRIKAKEMFNLVYPITICLNSLQYTLESSPCALNISEYSANLLKFGIYLDNQYHVAQAKIGTNPACLKEDIRSLHAATLSSLAACSASNNSIKKLKKNLDSLQKELKSMR